METPEKGAIYHYEFLRKITIGECALQRIARVPIHFPSFHILKDDQHIFFSRCAGIILEKIGDAMVNFGGVMQVVKLGQECFTERSVSFRT